MIPLWKGKNPIYFEFMIKHYSNYVPIFQTGIFKRNSVKKLLRNPT
jgi:hypothetical protein